jgi:hypothetical protein
MCKRVLQAHLCQRAGMSSQSLYLNALHYHSVLTECENSINLATYIILVFIQVCLSLDYTMNVNLNNLKK